MREIANEKIFSFRLATLQSDLNQALSEKDAAEQEVLTGKLAAERSDRQARQEQSRLQAEINSYKQRLERADADLVHCRRENLRLSEQIASLEKEVNILNVTLLLNVMCIIKQVMEHPKVSGICWKKYYHIHFLLLISYGFFFP